jgi:hypothetical protein
VYDINKEAQTSKKKNMNFEIQNITNLGDYALEVLKTKIELLMSSNKGETDDLSENDLMTFVKDFLEVLNDLAEDDDPRHQHLFYDGFVSINSLKNPDILNSYQIKSIVNEVGSKISELIKKTDPKLTFQFIVDLKQIIRFRTTGLHDACSTFANKMSELMDKVIEENSKFLFDELRDTISVDENGKIISSIINDNDKILHSNTHIVVQFLRICLATDPEAGYKMIEESLDRLGSLKLRLDLDYLPNNPVILKASNSIFETLRSFYVASSIAIIFDDKTKSDSGKNLIKNSNFYLTFTRSVYLFIHNLISLKDTSIILQYPDLIRGSKLIYLIRMLATAITILEDPKKEAKKVIKWLPTLVQGSPLDQDKRRILEVVMTLTDELEKLSNAKSFLDMKPDDSLKFLTNFMRFEDEVKKIKQF